MALCVSNKIDSGVVGLSFAEEVCPGQLPTIAADGYDPTFYELEPNTFGGFGAELSTVARAPLSQSRQRKKGTVVDLDAAGEFNQDWTATNFDRLFQGFFFADIREKGTTRPMNGPQLLITGATSPANTLTTAADFRDVFFPGQLVLVDGFENANNNGLTRVTAVVAGALTLDKNLVAEAGNPNVVVTVVGEQFGAGGVAMVLAGEIGVLTIQGAAPTAASSTVTVAVDNAADGDSLTVGTITYVFTAGAPADPYDIPIGDDNLETAANIAAALNGDVLLSPAHPKVSATVAGNVVTVRARAKGTAGNFISLTVDADDVAVGAAALAAGTGTSFPMLGIIPGEWVFLGGDAVGQTFVGNIGYARVGSMTDTQLRFDKTTFDPAAEAAGALTVRLFLGDVLKNEKDPDLVKMRTYQFQRTLGNDGDGTQADYLPGSVPNEMTMNLPLADKVSIDVGVVAGGYEDRTGLEGLKEGLRVVAPGEEAINTTAALYRASMTVLDPLTSLPTGLFAFLTEGTLTINNNVSPVKALGHLGAIDVTAGNFEVGGEMTAIFQTVRANRSIRTNADVTLDLIFAQNNYGSIWDIPLLTLGGGGLNIEQGQEIRVELETFGAENALGYTLLHNMFRYLPAAAMPEA